MKRMETCTTLGLTLTALMVICLAGCGPSLPETSTVTGIVLVNGKPVDQGKIYFYPEEGRPAVSEIASDGSYSLTTFSDDDGAILGNHKVTIKSTVVTGTPAPRTFEEEIAQAKGDTPLSAAVIKWIVPEPYSRRETTPLERTVERGGNKIDFDIEVK